MSRYRRCPGLKLPLHLGRPLRWLLLILSGAAVITGPMFAVRTPASAQAEQPSVTIVSPKDGDVVTANAVAVVPEIKNWTLRCDLAGTTDVAGTGHYHLELD